MFMIDFASSLRPTKVSVPSTITVKAATNMRNQNMLIMAKNHEVLNMAKSIIKTINTNSPDTAFLSSRFFVITGVF